MNNKKIISYASGGLGNILLPLCSAIVLAKKTGRKLLICWEPIFACMATFKDLFDGDMEVITKNDLTSCNNLKIYGNPQDIIYDAFLNKNDSLLKLSKVFLTLPVPNINLEDNEENIIIYHNNIYPNLNKTEVISELKTLKWKSDIILKIEKLVAELKIDKTVFGVQMRATDFSDGIELYIHGISSIVHANPEAKILVCSDSLEWEQQIFDIFPHNVIFIKKNSYVEKKEKHSNTWSNNFIRSVESVKEAVIDCHLLSKTNFVLYNAHSSFVQMVKYLA